MNKIHKTRLWLLSLFLFGLGLATALLLYALKQNINAFLTPSQVTTLAGKSDYHFRLGGLVKAGSLKRDPNSLEVRFIASDLKREIRVRYVGVLPDLFREGKGMIAEGHLDQQGVFVATQILAKHDENYTPVGLGAN
ncbi:MAG TPA: cytochrome c maturation protein CcmE [Gammaproteobacteria bacterium]|jgi:cytochrome c-type biogenesis protein CcmE|nr:cytochrome c maturation protein CcmE [Gammaproteobacteria bacterium]